MRTLLGFILAGAVVAAASKGAADAPALFPVQGYLTDGDGAPIDGPHRLTFLLYDAETEGDVLYTDDRQSVSVAAGHFVVYVGDDPDAPLDLALFRDSGDLWLEIVIDGNEVVQPRTRLGSLPYAAHAQSCVDAATLDGREASAFAEAGHQHSVSDITDIGLQRIECDDLESGSLCSCPRGKRLLSGGAYCYDDNDHLNTSWPASETAWQAWCENAAGVNKRVRIAIICAGL